MKSRITQCRIRTKNSFVTKFNQINENRLQSYSSNQFVKQLNNKINDQITAPAMIRIDLNGRQKRIIVPPLYINSIREETRARNNSQKNIILSSSKAETDRVSNALNINDSKSSFKVRKVSLGPFAIRNNFSSILTPKGSIQSQEIKQIQRYKTSFHDSNLAETNVTMKSSVKKIKEEKCLIAATKKLPFSLQKKNAKRKQTQKTNFTNINSEPFDLDISMILDQNEGPDTPFMRKGSFKKLHILPQLC